MHINKKINFCLAPPKGNGVGHMQISGRGTSVLAKVKGSTNDFHTFEWVEGAGGGGGQEKFVP